MSERMSLLEFLKERSGIRLSKLEAYLDLVDKASVQYIPKDLCKQEFSLSNGQFVITITELAGCWHWHPCRNPRPVQRKRWSGCAGSSFPW